MKQNKICPKCNHTDILFCKGETHGETGDNSVVLGLFKVIPIDRYVCCSCGYVEDWVDNEHLILVREKYQKEKKKKEAL